VETYLNKNVISTTNKTCIILEALAMSKLFAWRTKEQTHKTLRKVLQTGRRLK